MLVRLVNMESTNLFCGKGRTLVFVEEIQRLPLRESEEVKIIKSMMSQIQIQLPMPMVQEMVQQRLTMILTEGEFDAFNENVNFVVNGIYELKLDKGYMSFQNQNT